MSAVAGAPIDYQIARVTDGEGNEQLALVITTALTQHQFWIANASTYRAAAKQLHDTIIKAGNDMSKLVKPNGVRASET